MRSTGRTDAARTTPPGQALDSLEQMMRDGVGLRLLLARLPAGATLDDARLLRERILQRARRPSQVLRRAAGVERA
jgi:hypothetical protein